MNPDNLQTSAMTIVIAAALLSATACGSADVAPPDDVRDESFLALMGAADGKADGLHVAEGSADANAVLQVVNEYSFDELDALGLDRRLVANIIGHRRGDGSPNPYDTLVELDATPWTTMAAFTRLWQHTREQNLAGIFCHQELCYDLETVELDLEGNIEFDVDNEGRWLARATVPGSRTVREIRGDSTVRQLATSVYDDGGLDPWVVRRADGSLTTVTRSNDVIWPEHGQPLELTALQAGVTAAYDHHDELFVAASALDREGQILGVLVFRQTADGWAEEFKQALPGPRDELNARFIHEADGQLSLWVDADSATRKYSRTDGQWRESMVLDMAAAGFGQSPNDRVLTIHEHEGVVFIHRATWNFSRRQQVLRIEGNMLTAVIDLPTSARVIMPHADATFSVVHADGSLAHMRDDGLVRNPFLAPASTGDLVRVNGPDLYVLQGNVLRILRAR